MGRPAEQIEALQARVRELEGRCRAYVARIGALRTALKLTSLDVHDAEGAAKALGEDDDTADAERFERLTKAQEATPADVPPVLGSPADIWIPNTETTTPPVLVAGDTIRFERTAPAVVVAPELVDGGVLVEITRGGNIGTTGNEGSDS